MLGDGPCISDILNGSKSLNLSIAPCKELQYRLFYIRAAQNTSSNYSAEYEYSPEYFAVAEADTE